MFDSTTVVTQSYYNAQRRICEAIEIIKHLTSSTMRRHLHEIFFCVPIIFSLFALQFWYQDEHILIHNRHVLLQITQR